MFRPPTLRSLASSWGARGRCWGGATMSGDPNRRAHARARWSAIRCSARREVRTPRTCSPMMLVAIDRHRVRGGTECRRIVTGTTVQPPRRRPHSPRWGPIHWSWTSTATRRATARSFLVPPGWGSKSLALNTSAYLAGTPTQPGGADVRYAHGERSSVSGGWRARGRVDDTMNLGGIRSRRRTSASSTSCPAWPDAAVVRDSEGGGRASWCPRVLATGRAHAVVLARLKRPYPSLNATSCSTSW